MYQVKVNQQHEWDVHFRDGHPCFREEEAEEWSCAALPQGGFSILYKNRSFRAALVKWDRDNKTVTLQVNGQDYEVMIGEPLDRLLQEMGIRQEGRHKMQELKAPMPGLVLQIMVTPGQAVSKGDPLLVLEAMKMENVFKITEDAVIKEIKVAEKTAVEKGQVLIVLE